MSVFRYGREHYEDGEYVRYVEAVPGDGRDPVVRIVEDLGTIEIPCGKVDCRANCLEYLVRSDRKREDYALADCKLSPLVNPMCRFSGGASLVAEVGCPPDG
jgi:hypothetical protein